ncbi:YoaK family protein [Terribacillus sp. AE2B 122]|uniref:YoaK family protein n=1 Tax=Terribacillus sp. AE2B 122 TaxID=1331902 RepID=UPI0015823853|nr:YoaK family protein [Terribacillus sp. AE2B 122]
MRKKERRKEKMQIKRDHITILLLCAISGVIDVLGYIGLSHVFTANMTGNIVLLGIGIGDARQVVLSNAALALVGFIIGIVATVFIQRKSGKSRSILTWEFILFLLSAAVILLMPASGTVSSIILLILSTAMGMQTIAGRNLKIAGLSSTVLTSTLAAFIEGLVGAMQKNAQKLSLDTYLRGGAILLYLLGAAAGSLSERLIGLHTIWIGVALLALVLLLQRKKTIA